MESQDLIQSEMETSNLHSSNESSLFITHPITRDANSFSKSSGSFARYTDLHGRITSVSGPMRPKTLDLPTKNYFATSNYSGSNNPPSASLSLNQTGKADESVFSASTSVTNSAGLPRLLRRLSCGSGIEFQNSSFLNDSEAQFDLDINLDHHKISRAPEEPSFWLASKSLSPQKFTVGQAQYLNLKIIASKAATDLNAVSRAAELTKQLTNCKIQLRLYEKFLQDLIDTHNVNPHQLEGLHQHWRSDPLADSDLLFRAESYDSLPTRRHSSPGKEITDILTLVEDLHASLKEYQLKWKQADQRASSNDQILRAWASEIPSLLLLLGSNDSLDPDLGPEELLDVAVPLLKTFIGNLIAAKVEAVSRESEIRKQLEKLNLEKQSTEKKIYLLPLGSRGSLLEDYFRTPSNKGVTEAFNMYQMRIEELQREVDRLNGLSCQKSFDSNSDNAKERDMIQSLQRELDDLRITYDELTEKFKEAQEISENTVKSLNNRFHNQKRELLGLQSTAANFDSIQRDLEMSVEKQRALTSEKIKLSYQVEGLQREKNSLQQTVDSLTEKLQNAQQPRSPPNTTPMQSRSAEQLEDLFTLDVQFYQKLLRSFNKIADDQSLVDPSRKIEALLPMRRNLLSQSSETVNFALGYHSSVAGFFAKAVDVIVRDHIRLLLKQEAEKVRYETQAEQLTQRVKDLEIHLEESVSAPLEYLLRILELTNRWKAEREARVSENKAAQRKLNELRLENSRLE